MPRHPATRSPGVRRPYLVVKAIRLRIADYLRAAWGIIGCCAASFLVRLAVKQFLFDESDGARMIVVAATSLVVTGFLLPYWQKITPRSIGRALKG